MCGKSDIKITGGGKVKLPETCTVPGDKSISHRAVMLGAIAEGTTRVTGFLTGEDCLSTIECFRAMGIGIELDGTSLTVKGGRLQALARGKILDVGNSGTTLRLMTGLLSSVPFETAVTGDDSIKKRPMKRVVEPLSLMGAKISGHFAPVTITGTKLRGIRYTLPVASAQVKSAILLAGLNAEGGTIIEEPTPSRDHTELMLAYLGADISVTATNVGGRIITLHPLGKTAFTAKPISVPGDISSAAFLMVAAAIIPGASVTIKNVGINPTRTGIITVLREMGANIKIANEREVCGERIADISAVYSRLKGVTVEGALIPSLIDEIPIIAAAAMFAEGETIIKDAKELRVKETDRIQATADEFNKFAESGGAITPHEDGMTIKGGLALKGAAVNSCGDHRLAMSLTVIALVAEGESTIINADCADVSFPGFYELFSGAV